MLDVSVSGKSNVCPSRCEPLLGSEQINDQHVMLLGPFKAVIRGNREWPEDGQLYSIHHNTFTTHRVHATWCHVPLSGIFLVISQLHVNINMITRTWAERKRSELYNNEVEAGARTHVRTVNLILDKGEIKIISRRGTVMKELGSSEIVQVH